MLFCRILRGMIIDRSRFSDLLDMRIQFRRNMVTNIVTEEFYIYKINIFIFGSKIT